MPVPADTGIPPTHLDLVNGELVGVYQHGRFSRSTVSTSNAEIRIAGVLTPVGDVVYHGGYVGDVLSDAHDYDRYNRKTESSSGYVRWRTLLVGSSCGPLWGTGFRQVGVR